MGHSWVGDLFQRLVTALPVPRPRWGFGDFGGRPALAVPGDQVVLGGAASQTLVLFFVSLSGGRGLTRLFPG